MDNEKIAAALDFFENDEFIQAKEILQAEIKSAKNDYLKDKLGLKGNEEEPANTEED